MIDATRIHSFNSFVRMMYAYRGLRTRGVDPASPVLSGKANNWGCVIFGREAGADYQKPLGGLHGGFWPKFVDVRILYGNFSKYKVLMASSWA